VPARGTAGDEREEGGAIAGRATTVEVVTEDGDTIADVAELVPCAPWGDVPVS
jgi:hypothetical protein